MKHCFHSMIILVGDVKDVKYLIMECSDVAVATVDPSGMVKSLSPGTVSITASIGTMAGVRIVKVIERGKIFVEQTGTKIERVKLYVK